MLAGAAGLWVLSALASGPQARAAGVSVADKWGASGTVSLDNGAWRLVFARGNGAARVYDLAGTAKTETMSLVPIGTDGNRATELTACRVLEGAADGGRCQATFAGKGGPIEATFTLTSKGAIRVEPSATLKGIAVTAAYRYGVLPSRHLDDNVYDAADYPGLARLRLPSENLLVGLVEGGNQIVALAWPSGEQSAAIVLSEAGGKRRIEALEVTLAGHDLFVGAFSAPGIWYAKELLPAYEEQDVALDWKPPFAAAWKTQFTELGVPTTFRRLDEREKPWRPTIGFYIWPFFTENGKVLLHPHKKLACQGKALIYALEGNERTPYGFLAANLPLEAQQAMTELQAVTHYYILDPNPVPGGYIMNAHCNGRDQLEHTTLTVGAEAREVAFLDTHIMERVHECGVIATYHVGRSLTCMDGLKQQIDGWLGQESGNATTATFLRGLRETLTAMEKEYVERLDGATPDSIKARAQQVAEKFKTVIREGGGLESSPEMLFYINELNGVISLEEDQGRRFGTWGRKLFQQAGYGCVGEPQAAEYAREVRAVLREHMKYRQYEAPGTAGNPGSLLPKG
jgi:hypothetical protein